MIPGNYFLINFGLFHRTCKLRFFFQIVVSENYSRRGKRTIAMGKRIGISDVLYRNVCGIGKHLAVSVHGLREWRRRFFDSLHNSITSHWETALLHGNGFRSILESRQRENVRGPLTRFKR